MQRGVIIVAGGAGRRLGGVDKPWLLVRGRPIIEHVLEAASACSDRIVIVGSQPADWWGAQQVVWTLEEPAGSGPANAVRAGLAALGAVDEVLLLAGDAPFVADAVRSLCDAPMQGDGIVCTDGESLQYLLARLRTDALTRALDAAGASMRSVFDHLQIDTLEAHVDDADTWEDVAGLRKASGAKMSANTWIDEVAQLLGIDATMDVDAVLALTRDVAHNVERKNAPLTSYLLGYAAAAQGLSQAQVAELAERIGARAREIGPEHA